MLTQTLSERRFRPPYWLHNPHLQTVWSQWLHRLQAPQTRRERLALPDGDFVDLHWGIDRNKGPIVLILHGLGGGIRSSYAIAMLRRIQQRGWRAALLLARGASEQANKFPRGYHAGEFSDLVHVVKHIRQREQETAIATIGYSLGGSMLLNMLGRAEDRHLIDAAVAISVPYDLKNAAVTLDQGMGKIYQHYLLRCQKHLVMRKFARITSQIDLVKLKKVRCFIKFDDLVTAPLHGFKSADDYYTQCSPRQFLKHIQTPTLLIHAEDDPFMTADAIPRPDELSAHVQLELSRHGGHVGFVYGSPWKPRYWLEERIPEYLSWFLD